MSKQDPRMRRIHSDTGKAIATFATYDGDGKRVKKSNGMLYWTGTGSDALLETDLSGKSNCRVRVFRRQTDRPD